MLKKIDTESEPAKRGIFKWIIGILLLGGIVTGCFFIYRYLTQPSPQQLQQNREHKEALSKQIKEIEKNLKDNRARLEKLKRGEKHSPWETIDEFGNFLVDSSDKELVELANKRQQLIEEWRRLREEWNEIIDKIENRATSAWERQKNGQWKMLTDKLDKSLEVRARFDKFIKTFYQRFGEKKGIKIYEPRVKFYGFGHFYINEEESNSPTAEMGHTAPPKGEWALFDQETGKASNFPMVINLNQIYLLNHGSLGMDMFYPRDPTSGFNISFDKLTETIAHELAHAMQNIMNMDKGRKSLKGDVLCSQCESSGERDHNENLLHPDWAAEHAKLTSEIQQMIEASPEYQEFKKWWQSSK